jgi:HEAT repeat protein
MPSDALLAELAQAGYRVSSLTELRESGWSYREAVPALMRALHRCENLNDREDIVRSLSVPWARADALRPLIAEFTTAIERFGPAGEGYGWVVGNALEVLGDDSVFDELAALAADRRYGRARQMVVLALGKSKRPEAADVLLALTDDPDVDGHAVSALAKLRVPAARDVFQRKLSDDRGWVRREAKRALAKLPP